MNNQPCKHRGQLIQTGSHHPDIFQCPLKNYCVLKDEGTLGNDRQAIQVCGPACGGWDVDTVDVVITCHNYGRFLKEAIDSVLAQTHPASRIIVVDDASDDDTKQVCDQFTPPIVSGSPDPAQETDRRSPTLYYLRVEFRNVYFARKAGLALSTSDFVVFLDADDILEPTHFEECLAEFNRNGPDLALVTPLLGRFGRETGILEMPIRDINQANWLSNSTLCRRSALLESKAYDRDEIDVNVAEDWLVWRTVINAGFRATRIDKPLIRYRRHEQGRWDHVLKRRSYYDLAGLKYETVEPCGHRSTGEYLWIGPSEPPASKLDEMLHRFSWDVAGVTDGEHSIVRASVIRQFQAIVGLPYLLESPDPAQRSS